MSTNRSDEPHAAWREKLRVVIFEADTRAGKIFDVSLLIAIGVSVTVVVLESVPRIEATHGPWLRGIEWGFTILSWPLPGFRRGAESVRLADGPDGGTTVTYVGAFEVDLLGRLLWPLLRGRIASSWTTAFASLDDLIA